MTITYMNNSTGVHEDVSTYLKCGHFLHWNTVVKSIGKIAIHSNLNKYIKPFNVALFAPFTIDDSFISIFQTSHLIGIWCNDHDYIKDFSFTK